MATLRSFRRFLIRSSATFLMCQAIFTLAVIQRPNDSKQKPCMLSFARGPLPSQNRLEATPSQTPKTSPASAPLSSSRVTVETKQSIKTAHHVAPHLLLKMAPRKTSSQDSDTRPADIYPSVDKHPAQPLSRILLGDTQSVTSSGQYG